MSKVCNMSNTSKILHWIIFLSFSALGITALAANYFFAKEAIMQSFAFSLPALDVEIPPCDQLFIARVARRDTWEMHFWIGVLFAVTGFAKFFLFVFKKRGYKWLNHLSFLIIFILFLSGLPLYLRLYFDISADIQQLARGVHFYMAWVIILFLVSHLVFVIHKENSSDFGIISNMFRFKSVLFIAFLVFPMQNIASEWEKDPDYLRAIDYKNGKIGTKTNLKTIKNCPYAKCDEVSDDINRNVKTINIKTKNYPRMVAHLKKSVERGNPLAAKVLAKFLIGRIDYRSKVADPTLIKIGERDTGMKYKKYLKLAQRSLELSANAKDCYSMYNLAEFKRKGLLGFKKDPEKAKILYKEVLKNCDKNSFFYILSQKR